MSPMLNFFTDVYYIFLEDAEQRFVCTETHSRAKQKQDRIQTLHRYLSISENMARIKSALASSMHRRNIARSQHCTVMQFELMTLTVTILNLTSILKREKNESDIPALDTVFQVHQVASPSAAASPCSAGPRSFSTS